VDDRGTDPASARKIGSVNKFNTSPQQKMPKTKRQIK
jgi:hypothetical protein